MRPHIEAPVKKTKPKPPDDGGPAFPSRTLRNQDLISFSEGGMTLRQWYAGLAMQGIFACSHDGKVLLPEKLAALSYLYANAMITEGKK